MPGSSSNSPVKLERLTTHPGSDLRQLTIQYNSLITDSALDNFGGSLDLLWSWQTAAANSSQAIGRGSTDTAIATGGFTFSTGGVPEKKAAVTTGTAIGAQTVAADTWAIYALDIATGGTITVTAGAGNTTSAYTTEALAIAGLPARVTAKARMGYLTLKTKAATAWVAATDALAGGATGNPASTTNYYPFDGVYAPTGIALNANGVVCSAGQGVQGGSAAVGSGIAWTGGRNGVLIPTVLSRGSTDTNLQTTAFTYSARGVTNIAKAAVAAGTTLGALGTIPADKWGVIVAFIDSVGTITFKSGPSNYTTGYGGESVAINDLAQIYPTTDVCQIGYITVKTKAATAWVAGTDALAGGASGNPASTTNYYPTLGITVVAGMSSAQIASRNGVVVSSANY